MGWIYKNKCLKKIPNGVLGFVYLITNLTNNKKYLGKKLFTHIGYKQVNKKRKRIKVESDWKSYWSSSTDVQQDVNKLGIKSFRREILKLCHSKSECSLVESYLILREHALLRDDYYNSWMSFRGTKKHLLKIAGQLRIDLDNIKVELV